MSFTAVWILKIEKHTFLLRNPHGGTPSRTELFLGSGKSVGQQPCTLMTPAPLRATWGGSVMPQKTWFSDKAPRTNGRANVHPLVLLPLAPRRLPLPGALPL